VPAFVVAGVVAAAMLAGFGLVLGSLPGGPPSWPFFVGALAVLAFFWLFARTLWRGARPRYVAGLELRVERQELRRGDRVAAIASGEGELEVSAWCARSPTTSGDASPTSRAAA
jgi:membrane protein implicated in regulation of membrane protease activity